MSRTRNLRARTFSGACRLPASTGLLGKWQAVALAIHSDRKCRYQIRYRKQYTSFMDPQLIAIAGSQRGKVFTIDQQRCEVGRDSNWLPLIDDSASHHCVITKEQQNFTIQDLEGRGDTCVNGMPISKKNLRNGDREPSHRPPGD